MSDEKQFPVHPVDRKFLESVPWDFMAQYEDVAKSNHGGQSLKRLAERGGLSLMEMRASIGDEAWQDVTPVKEKNLAFITGAVDAWRLLAARSEAEDTQLARASSNLHTLVKEFIEDHELTGPEVWIGSINALTLVDKICAEVGYYEAKNDT